MKCRRTLLELNASGPYPSAERETKFRRWLFTYSIKREIRHFYVVVVQSRQRNVQKSVMHVQSCCCCAKFVACFLTFLLPSASLDLKVPILAGKRDSRPHSTTSFSENFVVAETKYQILEV